MSSLGWGIVGTGGIARKTISDIRLVEGCRVEAVSSRKQETADRFATEFGVPAAYGDVDALLSAPQVDVVYVCTPHTFHFDVARRAIEAGKHVLVEKPFTMTVAEALELDRLATLRGVFLMEAMWMKFNPSVRRALSLVESGAIGEPMHVQASMGFAVPPVGLARFWEPELGGGALYDMGVYTLTLAQLFLGGSPSTVSATGQMRDGIDLYESVTLGYANGATAQVVSTIAFHVPAFAAVGGTLGSIEFSEPFFAPGGLGLAVGAPPKPPVMQRIETAVEGLGHVPMFRAVRDAIVAGETSSAVHPLSATVEVLTTIEKVWAHLAR